MSEKSGGQVVVETGVTFGCALAITMSFYTNHSILWAILHGFFSWFYIIYRALGGGGGY